MEKIIFFVAGMAFLTFGSTIAQSRDASNSPAWPQGLTIEMRNNADNVLSEIQDTPMQKKLHEQHEVYVGAVYWEPGGYDPEKLLMEFRRMKEIGFKIVRFHNIPPDWKGPGEMDFSKADEWLDLAHQAGLKVIFMSGGPRNIPHSVYEKYDLDRETFELVDWKKDSRCQSLVKEYVSSLVGRYKSHPALYGWAIGGEPNTQDAGLDNDYDKQAFKDWLMLQYGTPENVDKAWNFYPGDTMVETFEDAWEIATHPRDHRKKAAQGRDKTRYLIEKSLNRKKLLADLYQELDGEHPTFNGSHQLLYNQASLAWDNSLLANIGDQHFSSIHLAWHYEPVFGEVIRPTYMMSRLTHDYSKKWSACFETTGGPVQYSGGYPNAMTIGLMRSLMLNYLAGGNLGIAFWTWNHRPGGWEAGEYGMITYSGELAPWTLEAGKIARGMEKYKEELWEAEQDLAVGILQEWDNDFIYTVEPNRHELMDGVSDYTMGTKSEPLRALVGVSRACINRHVPFEYVTGDELEKGLAGRYPCIYAPHIRAISEDHIRVLTEYVQSGGRLIADVQFAFCDPWSKMHPKGKGSQTEKLFGAWVDMIHDTRTNPKTIGTMQVEGLYGDIKTTDARVLSTFSDGTPAITEHRLGRGSAVLMGFDASRMCHLAGAEPEVEGLVADLIAAGQKRNWRSTAPMSYCLRTEKADHYFLLNDGPERPAFIEVYDAAYMSGSDVITGDPIPVDGTISVTLPKESAVWLRFEKTQR